MYTLYYATNACSQAVHALLNEMNVPFRAEKVSLTPGQPGNDRLLAVNPRAQVPVLQTADFTLREGAAIILWLCEQHETALMPANGPARAEALEWLCYLNSTLHPMFGPAFKPQRYLQDEAQQQSLRANQIENINQAWSKINDHLANRDYLCGSDATVADILLAVIAGWAKGFNGKMVLGAHVERTVARIRERPAFARAYATENAAEQQVA